MAPYKLQGLPGKNQIEIVVQKSIDQAGIRLLDGRALAAQIRLHALERARKCADLGHKPSLRIILAGDDEASSSYVKTLEKGANALAVTVQTVRLPASVGAAEMASVLREASMDEAVDAIILQQPLPAHLDIRELAPLIASGKDVDGVSPVTQGALALGERAAFTPATPRAVMACLEMSRAWPPLGKHAVVVGKSSVVGMPVALLLMHAGATVTVTHKDTVDLASHTRRAEILVVATGVAGLIGANMVRDGAVVIDVGTSVVDGTLVGDVNAQALDARDIEITPVPGGVGPVTTAILLANVVDAAEYRIKSR